MDFGPFRWASGPTPPRNAHLEHCFSTGVLDGALLLVEAGRGRGPAWLRAHHALTLLALLHDVAGLGLLPPGSGKSERLAKPLRRATENVGMRRKRVAL